MSKDTFWLVKSGGRIIGPLTNDGVINSLRSKEIVPLDEISISFGRWHYIRDEKVFELIVNELRNKKGGAGENTITETGGDTATDITERVSAFGPTDRLTSNISDQLNERKMRDVSSSPSDNTPPTVYGYSKDKEFSSSQKPKANIFIWLSLILVVGGISIKVISSRSLVGSGDTLSKARKEYRIGNFPEAAKFYREAYKGTDSDINMSLDFAGSLLSIHQSSEARKVLDIIVNSGANALQKSKAYTGLAVASIQDFDYNSARKYIDEAIKLESGNGLAYANLGIVNLFEAKYPEAEKAFLDALDRQINDPSIGIQLAEASYLNSKTTGSPEGILRAKVLLDTNIKNSQLYLQEALAYRLHISAETKDSSSLETTAIQFLNTDPQLTDDHIKDPFLARERVEWDHITKYLKTSITESFKSSHVLTALGLAMFKSREKLDGKKIIEDSQSKSPDDKLIRSVLSYAQMQVGRDEEGSAGLTIALEGNQFSLPTLLKARHCRDKKDYLCAEENWKKLLAQDDRSVVAIAGLAWTQIDKGKSSEAKELVTKGLLLDKDYIPMIRADEYLKGNQ